MPSWVRTCGTLGLVLSSALQGLAQNQVLELDGKDSYVELPKNIFNDLDEATIEGWVKFQEFRTESRFFDFGTMGPGMYVTETRTTPGVRFEIGGTGDGQTPPKKIELENLLRLNQWCHLAAVTGRSGMKLYLNGVLVGTNAFTGSFRSMEKGPHEIHNYLGRNNWRGFFQTEDFHGQMDEFRVWKTARTKDQIRDNLFQRLTGDEEGLIGLWNFDDGTARDLSPGLRHGNLGGNAKCVAGRIPSPEEAARPAVFHGKITDQAGTLIHGVSVGLEQGDSKIAEASPDQFGDYRMVVYPSTELYDLSATSGRQGDWRLGLRVEPEEWRRVDFALRDASILSGRVWTMDTNIFQPAVVVQAIRTEAPGKTAAPQADLEHPARVTDTQWTDPRGRFEFVNLKPGFYRLRCHGNERLVFYNQGMPLEVELGQARLGVDFRFPPVKKGLWRNYTLLDGLRNDDVHDLILDRDGLMWLATWGGVLRFDGVRWTRYTKEDGLSDDRVNALAADAKGVIWLATENGITRLANGLWHRYTKADGLADERVRAMAAAPDGAMWFGTAGGVSRFDGKRWEKFDRRNGLPDEDVQCIFCDPEGMLWFGTQQGVARYDGKSFTNTTTIHGLAGNGVHAIHRDPDGVMWFGTAEGVSRYNGRSFVNFTTEDGLLPGIVQSIHRDQRGILWFGINKRPGASEGGVTRWDGRTFVCLSREDGLAGNGVRSIRETPDGALWFATDAGVSRYDETTLRNFTTQDGLSNNEVSRLNAFSDGTIWFCRVAYGADEFHWPETDVGDGISCYDGKSFRTFTELDGLAGNRINAIYRDPHGVFWFTGQSGISSFDGGQFRKPITGNEWGVDGGITIYPDLDGRLWIGRHNGVSVFAGTHAENFSTPNVLANQHITSVHRDSAGLLWFATLNQGLWRYDGQIFSNFSTNHGLPSERICSIHSAADGTLWFRTGCGFASYDREKFSAFTCRDGMTDDRVTVLHIDPDGTVWAGTAGGGVSRQSGGKLTTFTATKNRLAHDKVNAIFRDAEGVLWFGTDGGVSRFNGVSWSSMDERDGLAGSRVNTIAQDANGAYWFGTDKGLTRYQPNRVRPQKPALALDTGEAAKPGETPTVLAGRRVALGFQACDLNNRPQNQKYRFQIQPGVVAPDELRDLWAPASDATHVEWATNKAGAYTFAVQYIDRDLRLSEPAIAVFHVIPPWYRNAWIAVPSGAGIFTLLGSSLFLGARYYAKRKESLRLREAMFAQEHQAREALEGKNAQLEAAKESAEQAKLEAERANKAKSLFLANMSHEIRTPMNAILGYAQVLQGDPDISRKQRQALETIRKSGDHLLVLINEILDLSKIEAGKMELYATDFDLRGLLKDVSAIFELRCRQKNLSWQLEFFDQSAWDRGVWVHGDSSKLVQVLMNLLANAVKFTEQGAVSLKVSARPESEYAFEVRDTGRGIPLDKQGELFRPFGQADQSVSMDGAGLGLAISKQRLELMGGTLQFESAPGQGSRFYFSLTLPPATPCAPATMRGASDQIRRLAPGFTVRALVVDDLPENRDVLCDMLSQIGCTVTNAANGHDALASVRSHRPDIVFMDIRLPDMDGFQATQRILEEFGRGACKIVSFSASAMDHERQAYLDAGFDDFLAKPLRLERIYESLRRLLKVEFESRAASQPDAATESEPGEAFSSKSFSKLLGTLKNAAEESNATQVRSCLDALERLGPEGKRAAAPLRLDLERYDFDAVLDRIRTLQIELTERPGQSV